MKQLFTLVAILIIALASNAQSLSFKDSLQIHSIIKDRNKAWEVKGYVLAAKWYTGDAYFTNAFGDNI